MNNCCSQCLGIAKDIYGGGINSSYCSNSNCPCHKPTDKETSGVFICRTKDTTGGEETHSACLKRIREEGGKARCCYCVPHKDCEFVPTPKVPEDWLKGLKLRLRYCQEQNGLDACKNCGLNEKDLSKLEVALQKSEQRGRDEQKRKDDKELPEYMNFGEKKGRDEVLKEASTALTKMLTEFANTPIDKRGNGWDWILKAREKVALLKSIKE